MIRTPFAVFCRTNALISLFLGLITPFFAIADESRFEVIVLTQPPKLLKAWTPAELKILAKKGRMTFQRLLFDESASVMPLEERAEIDLVTVHGQDASGAPKVTRVPRFMIWRDAFKLDFDRKTGEIHSRGTTTHLKLPLELFTVKNITKVELSQHHVTYPGTRLKIRTNPAASRGEKFFSQNCLACHSFSKPLDPTKISLAVMEGFAKIHEKIRGLSVDARDIRGLTAYAEALASERSQVESKK